MLCRSEHPSLSVRETVKKVLWGPCFVFDVLTGLAVCGSSLFFFFLLFSCSVLRAFGQKETPKNLLLGSTAQVSVSRTLELRIL